MQIAKIVPNVKTQSEGIFDYAIPPEILPMMKIGILVIVPFHGRKVEGIVLDIKRTSKIENLKPIISVVDTNPVIDDVHVRLSKWMSDYYLEPLNKCLFENIVPVAKRSICPSNDIELVEPQARTILSKKYLVIGDFQFRSNIYQKAIAKVLLRNQQVIILVPDLANIEYFKKFITKRISVIHSGLKKSERYIQWQKIRNNEVDVIAGSNSALFVPIKNLGLVIIDQEESETYKSFQSPRFHAVKVAKKLSELSGATLILGSITPSIDTYFEASKDKFRILRKAIAKKLSPNVVDMNFEKEIISLPLQKEIDNNLALNKKILLVLNRKGEGSKIFCPDCRWLHQYKPDIKLPPKCPVCNNTNLKVLGIGTKKLEKKLIEKWPKAKITIIEEGNSSNSKDWDIAIVTNFALKFSFPKIGFVGIIDADQGLNIPDFKAQERNFQQLFKFLRIGSRGIVQTHVPENKFIKALANLDYDNFFDDEIKTRKAEQFPPFTKIILLWTKEPAPSQNEKVLNDLEKIPEISAKQISDNRILIRYTKRPLEFTSYVKALPKNWVIDIDPNSILN